MKLLRPSTKGKTAVILNLVVGSALVFHFLVLVIFCKLRKRITIRPSHLVRPKDPADPTSTVSEHGHNTGHYPLWDEEKFIDCDPYRYTCRVKEPIHRRLRPNNRDSGTEIPEAWIPTIKKHNNRKATKKQTAVRTQE